MNAPLPRSMSLTQRLVERFGIDEGKLFQTLKATAFRQRRPEEAATDEQMLALMVVADQYKLNPFTKELYAYPDKQNGIVPVVSVDGWTRIINEHPALDGIEFRYSEVTTTPAGGKSCPEWCEIVISRKDRARPIVVREYLDEVYRPPHRYNDGNTKDGPWQSHTKRMLRHKALIQGSRIAFGFAGIYDDDEAQRIVERDITSEAQALGAPAVEMPRALAQTGGGEAPPVMQTRKPETVDHATGEIIEGEKSAAREPGEAKPLADGQRKILRAKMSNAGLTDVDLKARFGRGLGAADAPSADVWLFSEFNDVQKWIMDRLSGGQA